MQFAKISLFISVTTMIAAFGFACSFNEYAQTENLTENIDDHRTGCEVGTDDLLAGYKQYDANEFYFEGFGPSPNPTNTPSPITDTELSTALLLEKVWENGCETGRRDVVGAEQASLMSLEDQLNVLSDRIDALYTPTPVPTTTP